MQYVVDSDKIATINQLRSTLETFQRTLPLPELLELTSRLQLPRSQWQTDLVFNPHHFCFRTLFESPHFEINIIGWKPGQYSSVHDHSGTACSVLVLDGVLTNRDYQIVPPNQLQQTSRADLRLEKSSPAAITKFIAAAMNRAVQQIWQLCIFIRHRCDHFRIDGFDEGHHHIARSAEF